MRKNTAQMTILQAYFDKDPNWTYAVKMQIAS